MDGRKSSAVSFAEQDGHKNQGVPRVHAGSGDSRSAEDVNTPGLRSFSLTNGVAEIVQSSLEVAQNSVDGTDSQSSRSGTGTKPTNGPAGPSVPVDIPTFSSIDKLEALVPFPANLPAQYKALIAQIETSRHPNYPFILRRVYESGHLKNFLQYLDKRAEAHDSEIERVCAAHTLTLTETARDLMAVSSGVEELRDALALDRNRGDMHLKEIQVAGKGAATWNTALVNTALLIERISILKPVIKIVGEAQSCMENGQLVKALRKLHDAWERTRKLPHHIRLVKSLADNIPFMKTQLIMEAKRGVTTALESIRNANLKAGYMTLKNVAETNGLFVEPYHMPAGKVLPSRYTEEVAFLYDRKWSLDAALNLQPLLVFRHVMLNFAPDDLDAEAYKAYYENYMVQRRSQVAQMVTPPNNMHSVDHFRLYIQDIVGIFSLETYVSGAVCAITSDTFYSELWNDNASNIAAALSSNCVFITDDENCAQIKNLMNLFAVALNFLKCDSSRIHGVLQDIRDHYGEILLRKLVEQMNGALDEDKFVAITAANESDEQRLLDDFPFSTDRTEKSVSKYPKKFPFSSSVPKFYSLMKQYISTFVKFSRDLNLSQNEVDEKVRKSMNTVLSRNLRGCISGLVERGRLTPEQLVQLYSNCTYLEYSCRFLETYISELLNLSSVSGSMQPALSVRLDSDSLFKDIRSQVEQQVYTTLMNSIEAMVGESRFDSAAQEATNDPSLLCHRVIKYLEVVFGFIRNMPYSVCQTAWMTACKHIANQLQETFVHKSPLITIGGVQQLKNDLSFYEDFLLRQRDNTDPATLLMAFSDIRQLTDLLLLWDWNKYFHEFGKKDAKYNRIQPQTALNILEKMKESDRKKGSLLQNLRKNERDKKKLLDTIIVQLKDLISEPR